MDDQNITLRFKRDSLLEKLRAQRPALEKLDARNKADHFKEEKAYLQAFREALRESLKWDYETAAKNSFQPAGYGRYGTKCRPTCPRSWVESLDRQIQMVERSDMQRWNIKWGGEYNAIYQLLTADMKQAKEIC